MSDEPRASHYVLHCPCGQVLEGDGEDAIVEAAYAHLRDRHPDMADDYERADVLAMAVATPK